MSLAILSFYEKLAIQYHTAQVEICEIIPGHEVLHGLVPRRVGDTTRLEYTGGRECTVARVNRNAQWMTDHA